MSDGVASALGASIINPNPLTEAQRLARNAEIDAARNAAITQSAKTAAETDYTLTQLKRQAEMRHVPLRQVIDEYNANVIQQNRVQEEFAQKVTIGTVISPPASDIANRLALGLTTSPTIITGGILGEKGTIVSPFGERQQLINAPAPTLARFIVNGQEMDAVDLIKFSAAQGAQVRAEQIKFQQSQMNVPTALFGFKYNPYEGTLVGYGKTLDVSGIPFLPRETMKNPLSQKDFEGRMMAAVATEAVYTGAVETVAFGAVTKGLGGVIGTTSKVGGITEAVANFGKVGLFGVQAAGSVYVGQTIRKAVISDDKIERAGAIGSLVGMGLGGAFMAAPEIKANYERMRSNWIVNKNIAELQYSKGVVDIETRVIGKHPAGERIGAVITMTVGKSSNPQLLEAWQLERELGIKGLNPYGEPEVIFSRKDFPAGTSPAANIKGALSQAKIFAGFKGMEVRDFDVLTRETRMGSTRTREVYGKDRGFIYGKTASSVQAASRPIDASSSESILVGTTTRGEVSSRAIFKAIESETRRVDYTLQTQKLGYVRGKSGGVEFSGFVKIGAPDIMDTSGSIQASRFWKGTPWPSEPKSNALVPVAYERGGAVTKFRFSDTFKQAEGAPSMPSYNVRDYDAFGSVAGVVGIKPSVSMRVQPVEWTTPLPMAMDFKQERFGSMPVIGNVPINFVSQGRGQASEISGASSTKSSSVLSSISANLNKFIPAFLPAQTSISSSILGGGSDMRTGIGQEQRQTPEQALIQIQKILTVSPPFPPTTYTPFAPVPTIVFGGGKGGSMMRLMFPKSKARKRGKRSRGVSLNYQPSPLNVFLAKAAGREPKAPSQGILKRAFGKTAGLNIPVAVDIGGKRQLWKIGKVRLF